MKKIPRTAKIRRGRRPSPICLSEEFFESNYFQIGQHVVLLLINYKASEEIQLRKENIGTVSDKKQTEI